MNREIKFEYGFESVNGIVKKVYHLHEIPKMNNICDVWNVLPIKYVREFTGLYDKNGKEVFEGDLVKVSTDLIESFDKVLKVQYNVDDACFEILQYWISQDKFVPLSYNLSYYQYEVIGNIFENPELLNQ